MYGVSMVLPNTQALKALRCSGEPQHIPPIPTTATYSATLRIHLRHCTCAVIMASTHLMPLVHKFPQLSHTHTQPWPTVLCSIPTSSALLSHVQGSTFLHFLVFGYGVPTYTTFTLSDFPKEYPNPIKDGQGKILAARTMTASPKRL